LSVPSEPTLILDIVLRRSLLYLCLCLVLGLGACGSLDGVETETPVAATPRPSATLLSPTPTNSPAPTPLSCWGEGGAIVPGEIESELVISPFAFLIYLPPCYEQEPERSYPVLYLIHGQSFNQDQWIRLGVGEVSDALIAAGEISPFIIVMPQAIDWAEPPEVKFGQAVVEELIPYIDATYRTIPEREYRAVGGLSRGAGWALHLGLRYWEMFGAFGGHSLPIFWSDSKQVRGWLADIPEESFPRIYVDLATQDLSGVRSSTNWFIGVLEEEEYPYQFYVFPGKHNEAYWSAHVEEYIRFYTAEW
jgi:enterochelin esterase-like enzyme